MKEQNLIAIANKFLEITQKDETVWDFINLAKKEFESQECPAIQLYGVSQAGKSTLLSCLTLGEQYIPVGTGKATTAVKVELVNVNSQSQHQAEIEWFSSADLLELVRQPLDFFIKVTRERNNTGPLRFIPSSSPKAELTLDSLDDRAFLWEMLGAARRARRNEADQVTVGGGNDLAVAEIILSHYEEYAQESRGIQILYDFSQLPKWTRQPYEWGSWEKRPLADYRFDELRSFFTRKVRLSISTQEVIKGLRVLDSPGFGISHLHDRICRSAQEESKAVILILGTQFTHAQMIEIQQLASGLRDNLFVIWNPKDGKKDHAQAMLQDMLDKLSEETGIYVPIHNAAVANLHLALRAMQWEKIRSNTSLLAFTEASLAEMFSRQYEEKLPIERYVIYELRRALEKFIYAPKEVAARDAAKISRALELSGWSEVTRILATIKKADQEARLARFGVRLLAAMLLYLEGFPTFDETKKAVDGLNAVLKNIREKTGSKKDKILKKSESRDKLIFDEFLDYLTDPQGLGNLRSNVKSKIDSATHYSTVPGEVEHLLRDYVDTKCSVWAGKFTEFATPTSKEQVLGPYEKTIFELEQWVNEHVAAPIEFPSTALPRIVLEQFRQSFRDWTGKFTGEIFTPDWLSKFVSWIAEVGVDLGYQAKKAWAWCKSWFSEAVKPPEKKPSFDRTNAFQSVVEKINKVYSKETFEYIYKIGKDPSFYQSARNPAQGGSEDFYSWFKEMEEQAEIDSLNALSERCQEFWSSWRKIREAITKAVNTSLTTWTDTIHSTISERNKNLQSESISLLDQETLESIESLVTLLKSTIAKDQKDFQENLSKLTTIIAGHKITTKQ